jgi:hypothetical protein
LNHGAARAVWPKLTASQKFRIRRNRGSPRSARRIKPADLEDNLDALPPRL